MILHITMTRFTSCLMTSPDFLLVHPNCVKAASQTAPTITTVNAPTPWTQTCSERVEKETEFIHVCQRVVWNAQVRLRMACTGTEEQVR